MITSTPNLVPCESWWQVNGANADLHQAAGQLFFHDARERAGMREPIAIEFIVKVRVSVEVKDGQVRIVRMKSLNRGIGHRVVAA